MAGGQDKTEKATPRRRKDARRKGEIGNTPELGAWVSMLVASWVLPRVYRSAMGTAGDTLAQVGPISAHPDVGRDLALVRSAVTGAVVAVLPLALMVMVIAVLAVAGQGGLVVAPKLLVPKFSRLNPLKGVTRLFGPQGAWQLVKALLKTAALAAVVYISIRGLVPSLAGAGRLPLATLVDVAVGAATSLVRWASVAGIAMAVVDYVVVRRRNDKALKMTRQEVRDELKNTEGDPLVKHALRSRALAAARTRMFAAIESADVVVVNPTHVAVALRYDPAHGAPTVVAKGADHVAARIRAEAERHRVPMVADVPLARALHAACDVGQEIPTELFHAVATVLAFLMGLKRKGSTAGVHRLPRPTTAVPPEPARRRRRVTRV